MTTGCNPTKLSDARKKLAELGHLVGAYFRNKHLVHAAKRVASEYDVCPRTAEDWVTGRRAPAVKHLVRMVAQEGMRFVQHVIHPIASREADAQHITVREYLARQRAENERQRILAREASAVAGSSRTGADRVVRAAGAAVRLIGKLSLRRRQTGEAA